MRSGRSLSDEKNKSDKPILNKVMILPFGLVILFIVYRTLVFSVIMNCIPIMQEHYIIAEMIRNCIDIMTIVVLMIIFKVKTGRGGVKGYLKGVGIYGVPVLMFTFLRLEILRFGYLVDIFLRTKSVGAVITLHFLWDFADFMNHMMIVERYRYGGAFNALALQIPVLIVMLVIAVFCIYNKSAWECKQCF